MTKTLKEIIDICHRKGVAFEASREIALAGGATVYSIFKTGSKPAIVYFRGFSFSGDGVNVSIFRDPTHDPLGEPDDTIRNPNDINPEEPTSALYAAPGNPSATEESRAPFNIIASDSSQSKGAPIQTIGLPQLVLPNKEILLSIESRAASQSQQVFALFAWVEPDRIPGLVINENGDFVSYTGEELLY